MFLFVRVQCNMKVGFQVDDLLLHVTQTILRIFWIILYKLDAYRAIFIKKVPFWKNNTYMVTWSWDQTDVGWRTRLTD